MQQLNEDKMLEMSLPSAVEYLPLVDSLCQAFCFWTGMSKDVTDDMAIAVVEAATNAVVHGNKCDKSKKVTGSFKRRPAEIVVSVTDQGRGFNPDRRGEPGGGRQYAQGVRPGHLHNEAHHGQGGVRFPQDGRHAGEDEQVPHLRQGPDPLRRLRREAPRACAERRALHHRAAPRHGRGRPGQGCSGGDIPRSPPPTRSARSWSACRSP